MVPRSSQVNVLQLEQQSVGGMEGDGVSGVGEVGRSQEEVRAQGQLLILPRCWQNLGLQIRKVKCGEGHTPRQEEEELLSPPHPSHPPASLGLSQVNTPVRCHVDARLAQDQHRGLRVMLEGQAAFGRSFCLEDHGCWLSGPYYHHPLNPDGCLKVASGVC